VLRAFRAIFQIESTLPDDEVCRQLGVAAEVARNLVHQLKISGDIKAQKTYQNCLPAILNVLCPHNLDIVWKEHKSRITEREMIALQLCSVVLSETNAESEIDAANLSALLASVEELHLDVLNSDMSLGLKRIVLDNLHRIKTAIHDYYLRGAEPLEEALAMAVGSAVIHPKVNEKSQFFGDFVEKWSKLMDALKKTIEACLSFSCFGFNNLDRVEETMECMDSSLQKMSKKKLNWIANNAIMTNSKKTQAS
jgi:hypothetical protein